MSIDDPVIAVVYRFAGPLAPIDREPFFQAATIALQGCRGEGDAYRAVTVIWKQFFRPPPSLKIGGPRWQDI